MSVYITKSDGVTEAFDESKLTHSLVRAGAAPAIAKRIATTIEKELWSGISTKEIYSRAFKQLYEHKHGAAARYSIKRSIMEFGPSGFPFEEYIAQLFRAEGYVTEVDQLVQGACVEHEVDVLIHKDKENELVYAEAKFHNTIGFKTDLKTVLYIQARILDLRAAAQQHNDKRIISGLVVTNTKFTDKALQYAQCQGLAVLGWDNPTGATLHNLIEKHSLYPVTVLTSLKPSEKMALLSKKIVLCSTLQGGVAQLRSIGVDGKRQSEVLEEVQTVCFPEKDIQ